MTVRDDFIRVLTVFMALGENLVWTAGSISDLFGWTRARSKRVLANLCRRGFVVTSRGHYFVTNEGRDYLQQARDQCRERRSISAFKDEALTGIRPDGTRSKLTAAVLPTGIEHTGRQRSPEDQMMRAQAEQTANRKHAEELGLTVAELEAHLLTGRVHRCEGGGVPHIGIFDKNGKGWRNVCRKCRKEGKK
jgi:DNA-binding MarR family transcriptional regulator